MKHYIWITGQFEAYHRWASAPEEVEFLRAWHRHLFKVKVTFGVNHNDRDLEFFIMQRKLKKLLATWDGRQVENSCEMFAEAIAQYFIDAGHKTITEIEVSEDGENGSLTKVWA